MAVTPQQRRAAFIALMLTASAGGGYVAKDELIAIGRQYCGPVPKAVLELSDGRRLDATPQNIERLNQQGAQGATVKLQLNQATGLLAAWCDPDRQRLDDDVGLKLTKGDR